MGSGRVKVDFLHLDGQLGAVVGIGKEVCLCGSLGREVMFGGWRELEFLGCGVLFMQCSL